MERRLIIMRHAKSSWTSDAPGDHERPLNPRGQRSAPLVAARLHQLGWIPDAVISSDSRRTRETWQRMADAFAESPVEVEFRHELYLAGLDELRSMAFEWSPDWGTILTLGHNPGWEDAVSALAGQHERMTTANAALLRGEGARWEEALRGAWQLESIIRPKEL